MRNLILCLTAQWQQQALQINKTNSGSIKGSFKWQVAKGKVDLTKQKEISEISITNLINQFKKAYREFDISNVAEKLKGINKNNDSLNKSIADNSSIEVKSIGEIEISILRQSIFEIENSEIDYPIVINEAVKLAKKFGQEDSYRFINGVLDSYIAAR